MKQNLALDGSSGAGARRTSFRQKPDGKIDPAGEAGWYLQYERERRGETLADAAIETKIKARYLHALELGALDQIPGWPYVIGYVRSYAKFLGLEPEPLVDHYMTFVRKPAIIERFAGRSAWLRHHEAVRATAAFAGAAVIAVIGLWAIFSDGPGSLIVPEPDKVATSEPAATTEADPIVTGSIRLPQVQVAAQPPLPDAARQSAAAPETKPSVVLDGAVPTVRIKEKSLSGKVSVPKPIPKSAVLQNDVETALAAEGVPEREASDLDKLIASELEDAPQGQEGAKSKSASATSASGRIVLRARANVWARIEDGEGNALLNRTLAAGEVFHVPDGKSLVLIVRDAGALEFSLDGKPYVRLGKPGEILVSHPLEPDRMRSLGG